MKDEIPDRYFMEGIAEANIFGMAAGMAMEGYIPYVNTISTFITRRAFEQVAIDLCLHDLPVRMIGNGGGYVYAPLGPTHQAIEDFATMRSLPNMTVVSVCDAEEVCRFMEATLNWPHPIYIRLGKGGDPIVSKEDKGFTIGKAITILDAASPDIAILTTGIMAKRALEAATELQNDGYSVTVIHHHTIKPIDRESIKITARSVYKIVTLEEHNIIGGFGSAVAEVIMDEDLAGNVKLSRIGIPDVFCEYYGSQNQILDHFGLSVEGIVATTKEGMEH
jgi:transketolase